MRSRQTPKVLVTLQAVVGIAVGGVEIAAVVGTAVHWRPPRSRDRPNQRPSVK